MNEIFDLVSSATELFRLFTEEKINQALTQENLAPLNGYTFFLQQLNQIRWYKDLQTFYLC